MTLVIKTQTKKKSPHLALTHNELQNGSANGRNVSLLMKSDIEITPEIAAILKAVTGEEIDIEKASYEMLRKKLNDAIKSFDSNRWDWSYVEDFDESNVVFSNDKGVFYASYTVNGNNVTLGNEAHSVNKIISYEEKTGGLILSESSDGIGSGVHSLVVKSFDSISNNEKIKDIFKSEKERGIKQMEVEIQKAVEKATADLSVKLEKANADLQKAVADGEALKAQVEAFEKSAKDAKSAARLASVKEVQADEEKAVALSKSLEALDDESFANVIKSMKEVNEKVEGSDLFTRVSKSSDIDDAAQESETVKLLKQKYAVKQ